ncbi:teichoic acid D-Ala incorporation-associated protein DltX [Oenococcus oeni]|nr:teichoic acid D-Ala incorporation-associated protein DltX [Oenococcus oeni]KGH85795.1 D-alanyl-lipoteichoic acid biosynthesis protein [Oenococcus oeni IOEB_VF]KGH94985.1 D-alanyl-lipoteichoic acid biosynthesis protein [Oenococcus oeni IOEB_S436a]KGH96583.1 D-alanyl-lipoteichoic acid biosynthesis protein [Oenococcus oeni IOEB_1491]KGI00021.1 D-alanyl-lipoteichoic acid biosynthesis protein [Oenococcus oeni IOEB_L18_3]KGI06305.1 D-alanyl-lipoteichoic acid biosynthesis protein [Oenococcus oeni 
MKDFLILFHSPTAHFIGRTFFYFAILVVLLYLYSYTGVSDGGFIYNGF